jgi:hypothetical protein
MRVRAPAIHRQAPASKLCERWTVFRASARRVPFVPFGRVDKELFFEDAESNEVLIELRRFIVDFIERLDPDTPQTWQWERNIET